MTREQAIFDRAAPLWKFFDPKPGCESHWLQLGVVNDSAKCWLSQSACGNGGGSRRCQLLSVNTRKWMSGWMPDE